MWYITHHQMVYPEELNTVIGYIIHHQVVYPKDLSAVMDYIALHQMVYTKVLKLEHSVHHEAKVFRNKLRDQKYI